MRSLLPSSSLCLGALALLWPAVARSQEPEPASPVTDPQAPAPAPSGETPAVTVGYVDEAKVDLLEGARPPPTNIVYFQYGVAFVAEVVSSAGRICDSPHVPCILGPGGGVAVRVGFRGAGPIYLGGVYEMSKQDPSKLYRFALLQQARAEGRYYLMTARVTEPYASAALGVAGYGNEWSIDTWGPSASLGAGIEYQVTQRTVVGIAASYRVLYLSSFTDTSGAARDGGIAQLVGLDVVLEQRDPSLLGGKYVDNPHD